MRGTTARGIRISASHSSQSPACLYCKLGLHYTKRVSFMAYRWRKLVVACKSRVVVASEK